MQEIVSSRMRRMELGDSQAGAEGARRLQTPEPVAAPAGQTRLQDPEV